MSFKKQQPYQPDMFKVPLLPSRSEKYLYDPKDPLQRADEAENIRPLTLSMGEPCPLGSV